MVRELDCTSLLSVVSVTVLFIVCCLLAGLARTKLFTAQSSGPSCAVSSEHCQSDADNTTVRNISDLPCGVTTSDQIKAYHDDRDLQHSLSFTLSINTSQEKNKLLSSFLAFQCCFPNQQWIRENYFIFSVRFYITVREISNKYFLQHEFVFWLWIKVIMVAADWHALQVSEV